MDNFDLDTVDKYVKVYKRKIVSKLETYNLNERDLKNHSDLLCMVLEYSPRGVDERKINGNMFFTLEKYSIKTVSPEILTKAKTRTYLLEKQTSNDSESSEDESQMKSSKFSSRFDTTTQQQNLKKAGDSSFRTSLISKLHPNVDKMSIDVKTFVQGIVKDTIERVFTSSKKFKEEITLIEDEEDEYFDYSAIDRRRESKTASNKRESSDLGIPDKKKSHSKFGDNFKVKVFLFKTKYSADVNLFINETIYELKLKVIDKIQSDKTMMERFKLSYFKPDGKFYLKSSI